MGRGLLSSKDEKLIDLKADEIMPDVSEELMTALKRGRRSAAVVFLRVVGDEFKSFLSRNCNF